MDYCLEEWEFGWELGEFGGSAIDDIGDGSAVRVDGVVGRGFWRGGVGRE